MQLNEDTLRNKWNDIRLDVKRAWNKLTDEDLDRVKDNFYALGDIIEKKYEMTKEQAKEQIDKLMAKFTSSDDASKKQTTPLANQGDQDAVH